MLTRDKDRGGFMWSLLNSCRSRLLGRRVVEGAARHERSRSNLPSNSPTGKASAPSDWSKSIPAELHERLRNARNSQERADLVAEAVQAGISLSQLEVLLDWLEATRQIAEQSADS